MEGWELLVLSCTSSHILLHSGWRPRRPTST